MEETSKHCELGRHQSCSEERIEVLSDAIERHRSLRNTPSLLYPESVRMATGEIIYEKVYASPRPPPKISLKHDWMKELGLEVARQAEGSQPTQPNPNPDHDRTGRPVVTEQTSRSSNQEIDTRFFCDCKNLKLNVDANHDRTGRPVVCSQQAGSSSMFNEVDIDFRISGLPHSVVKQAENSRVRGLAKKIENHPHRQDLQADLQQNNAYNPFTEKSKKMIKDTGNVELFELCETNPKVQCKECLLYWNQGIVYCTCGHLLRESAANRNAIRWTLHLLSIQNYVIKKGRPHGHRFGKTKEQKDHHIAHNLRKRCMKRGFKGIHDRFLKDDVFRESQLEIDRTEEVCIQMDKDATKAFTYHVTQGEYFRYRKNWWISLNRSGKNRTGEISF